MKQHDQEKKRTSEVNINIPIYDGKDFILPSGIVSVGIPIRNGGRTLRYALDSIINQDYQNLEIIISDNNSTDDTALIALEYQRRDKRIIYHRQPKFLTALENIRFVLDEARGDYFMWAAHDDTRSLDYVSGLLRAMQSDPEPILAFGDLYTTDFIEGEGVFTPYDFDNTSLSPIKRIRKAANLCMMCAHFYGIWRVGVLRSIRFHPCTWAPDQPIMLAAAYLGKFKYSPGPKFTYLAVQKSASERAAYQDGMSDFNKYRSILGLFLATYKTSAAAGGMVIGMTTTLLVAKLHARNLPRFILRKLQKTIFTRT
jgi:glycosyltransferase involved in cell wall biosynthesis